MRVNDEDQPFNCELITYRARLVLVEYMGFIFKQIIQKQIERPEKYSEIH